ncbi:polyphosphate polymerase domain-containing protein [Aporhodopirellula aestuarii]|uniref:Polyphosphate polymerase domain-containing protein n=1 Tax=Aporhodopirellula aestuarii TaxID=2950107 RepID=A0ABT0UD83_9BACT|nr:polyphosphate polymerase domain-containing protein [Aporhodopirellula aestuarii]MCM2374997.1 polyphosphate polymerase domain-containing protein [Aporhodopirellula aestuarii]
MTNTDPSLRRVEMKFMLDESLSSQVRDWAIDHLGIDENCDEGNSYDINSLYLDTPELDLYHRTGVIGKAKHRIRRYGRDQMLVLESKRKKNMVVRKNRTAVFESDLTPRLMSRSSDRVSQIADSATTEETVAETEDVWCGDWFMRRLVKRNLAPAVQIAYRRFARTSMIDGENLRLTIDSNLTAAPADNWNVAGKHDDFLEGDRNAFRSIGNFEILELKFQNSMPHLFKELLRTFPIPGTNFSKYRTAIGQRITPTHRSFVAATVPRFQTSQTMEFATDA